MKKAFLFMLSLLAIVGIQAQTSPYEGAVLADGEFFLYNVETGLWLQNNDGINRGDWNTRGAVGSYGFEFAISAIDGGYQLNPKFGHNGSMNASNFYLDTNDGVTAWVIEAKDADGISNAYSIKFEGQALGVGDDGKLALGADAKSTWQFVTRAERVTYLEANASANNPVDATFLIQDPGFAHENLRASAWVWARDGGNLDDVRVDDGDAGYRCRRSYAVWNTKDFTLKQTIANVPNGKYQLTIKGYYRDGNRDDVANRRAAGTERLLANYFVGESKAKVMSILDGAAESRSDGLFYYPDNGDAPYGYYPDNADAFNRIFQDFPASYTNAGVTGIVSDGTLVIGVEKIEANGSDWFAFDDFRIKYLGNEIDLSEFLVALQNAIDVAGEYDSSTTSTVLRNALNEALQVAQSALNSTNQDEITGATSALSAALSAAQAVNVSVLEATAALAKAEGIDTAVADDLVANATEPGSVNAALSNLCAARKIKALGGAEDIYSGSEPVAGDFYFFNIGTGMWLNQGSDWCTHAAVDQAGMIVTLEDSGEGFIFRTLFGTFNNSPYTDTGANTIYTFQAVEGKDKVYNILEGSDLLGWNPDGKTDGKKYWNSISNTTGADPADPNFQWKLVSREERDLILGSAKKDAPVDATYLINNPSLMRQPGYDMWTKEVSGGNGGARVSSQDDGNGDRAADYGWEVWNADNFKFYQTIEGLAPGLYEVSVQGFWREGDGGNQANIVSEGGTLNQKAYLYANDAQTLLPNIACCPDFVPGVGSQATAYGSFPNWPREAFEYFETGAYKATVQAFVDDDGVLTIGVGCDEKVTYGDWVVFDNFRLTYLGYDEAAALQAKYERALATLEDGKTYRIFTETVDGAKRYLSPVGYLVDNTKAAATFTFKKVEGAAYDYGFLVDAGSSRFSNPPGTNESNLKCGYISTSTASRTDWDAQVFFLNTEGKYAVRCTNAPATTSGWGWVGSSYWTVETADAGFVAQYAWDPEFIWQIEENVDERIEAFEKTQKWAGMLQSYEGLVTDASQFKANSQANESIGLPGLIDEDYSTYFHTQWGASGVTEAHYLQAELPNAADKFYFYFVKRDPINNSNVNNRPTDILISGSNDGETFTSITEITEGLPSTVPPVYYMSGKITASEPYKFIRFTVLDTNNHAADNNGNKFFTFSEFYILPGDGITAEATKYMVSSYTDLEFEDVTPINELDALLNTKMPELPVNVIFNGDVVKTENVKQVIGKAPIIPGSFNNGLVTLSDPDVATITDGTQEVNVTATWAGPFEFSTDPADAKWYNMTIRGDYYVSKKDSEPYYPGTATELQKISDEFQWAFGGSPYNLVIFNKATGTAQSLTKDGSNVVLRDGMYAWELFGNSDGFVIREPGTETNWVNQNGGSSGPLQFWNSASGKTDNGSTFRVSAVPDASTIYGAALAEALEAANAAAAVPAGALFSKSADDVDTFKAAIAEQQAVADNDAATPEELKAALEALETASAAFSAAPTVAPEDGAKYTFQMAYTDDGVFFMHLAEGESSEDNPKVTIQAEPTVLTFVAADTEGQYYLKAADADLYLGKNGTNSWDMTADPAKKAAWTFTALSDGSYVINDPATAKYVAATSLRSNNKVTPVAGDAIYFDKSLTNGYVNWLIAPYAAPVVALNAPTWSAAEGTQAEPTWLPIGETLKINFTAENLEANGLSADELKVQLTLMVSGDLPENIMTMGSTTAHRVMPTDGPFEIPLGETDFPVELKEGYVYQNIVVMSAQLVKGEEVIATAAAPAQLHWIGVAAPIKGDADGDGEVDVADHAVIRENILSDGEYAAKLDINEDNYVDVADLTGLVNILLYNDWQGGAEAAGVRGVATADVLTLNYVGNGRYALQLQSGRSFNGLQMDINVPAGMTILSEEVDGSHAVATSILPNGKIRVLVYSMNNAAFEGSNILYLNVAGQGSITADNIVFADVNANTVRMTLGDATGINGIEQASDATIYDLGGRKADTMRRGVNIVRKADGTTKKILK